MGCVFLGVCLRFVRESAKEDLSLLSLFSIVVDIEEFCHSEDIWQCLGTFLVVTTGDELLASSGQRVEMLSNSLQWRGQLPPHPPTKSCHNKDTTIEKHWSRPSVITHFINTRGNKYWNENRSGRYALGFKNIRQTLFLCYVFQEARHSVCIAFLRAQPSCRPITAVQ